MLKMIKSLILVLSAPYNTNRKTKAFIRILWWKVNQLLFNLPSIVTFEEGFKCICYPDSSIGGLIIYEKYPEYWDMKYFAKMVKKDSVVVDVGASIGIYSLIALSKSLDNKVYSFEPDSRASKIYLENVRINNYSHYKLENRVVSDKTGYEYFSGEKESEISHISKDKDHNKQKIPSVALDDYLVKMGIKHIDIVKIDVEGAELKVLRGLSKYLRKKLVKQMIIEINPKCINYGYTPKDTIIFLKKNGCKLTSIDKNGRLRTITSNIGEKTTNIIAAV